MSEDLLRLGEDMMRASHPQVAQPTDLISEPGAYDVDLNRYHSEEICDDPSISASGLKLLVNNSPAHFWLNSTLNPRRVSKSKKHFRIGNAAHLCVMFGEQAARDEFFVIDDKVNLNSKEGRSLKEEAAGLGQEIVREADIEKVVGMARAIDAHPYARKAFENADLEQTLAWKDSETGVWCRCRPDILPKAMAHIPDYKTTTSARALDLPRQVWNFDYHIQVAFYLQGIEAALGVKPRGMFFIFQEKEPPYSVSVAAIENEWVEWGKIQVRHGLHLFADCLEKGRWPKYPADPVELKLPAYALYELQERHSDGEFTSLINKRQERAALNVEPEELITSG